MNKDIFTIVYVLSLAIIVLLFATVYFQKQPGEIIYISENESYVSHEVIEGPRPIIIEGAPLKEVTIEIGKGYFKPANVTVQKDAVITWTNADKVNHGIVAIDKKFYTPILKPGESSSINMTETGKFSYIDRLFPKGPRGEINVVLYEPSGITGSFIYNIRERPEFSFGLMMIILLSLGWLVYLFNLNKR